MKLRRKSEGEKSAKPRSVDGFVSSNPMLDQHLNSQQISLDSTQRSEDGLSAQSGVLDLANTSPQLAMTSSDSIEKKSGRPKLRKTLKIVGWFLTVCAVLGLLTGGFIFAKGWITARKIFKGGGSSSTLFSTDVKPEKLKGEGDGRINILLLGIGGGNHDGADLTDSIVIASIDPVAKDIALLSLPRDLWVKVPGYWSMKINAAYASAKNDALHDGKTESAADDAGFATLESVIQEYIGVPIHYHALVNFQAFAQGVDAIGGVDVNVEEDLYDSFLMGYKTPLIVKAGWQHMDGRLALLYAQSRHSSSDFDRGKRQRLLLIAIKEKILKLGTFSNPKTVSKLIDALGSNITVNATLGEMMRMYQITKDIPSTSIANIGLTDESNPLVTTGDIDGQSVVYPRAGLTDYSAIQSFVRNTLRDPFLKSENATIAVLNGSASSGLAAKKADELKSYGYNVTIVDSAPSKDHQTTLIYDTTNGVKKYTRNYLEKRLGVVTSKDTVPADILAKADFIVVLGTDANTSESN